MMGSGQKTFSASRLVAAGFFLFSAAMAALIFLPGATEYVAHATLTGRLRLFNSWEPTYRLMLAYALCGGMAFLAVAYLRLLIDNTMVVMDDEGIAVRHPFSVRRAHWRDFSGLKVTKMMGTHITLQFAPGEDGRGRRLSRKVRLPASTLGVDIKAILAGVEAYTTPGQKPATRQFAAAPVEIPSRIQRVRPMGGPPRAVFGKRR